MTTRPGIPPGTAGSVGAAAAVAEVLQLDEKRFANALAVAATMGAGLRQTLRSDSMGKPLHSGHAAQSGVIAGLAAAEGFTGTLDALDGENGMGVGSQDVWTWLSQTTVKSYSCCGHTFAAIDIHDRSLAPGDIIQVEVDTYAAAIQVAGNPAPRTPYEAKFSLLFVVACALKDGIVDASSFGASKLDDDEIQRVMSCVGLRQDTAFTDVSRRRRGARFDALNLRGERVFATVPDRRGDPSNPISTAQMSEKFFGLVSKSLGLVSKSLGPAPATELAVQIRAVRLMQDVRGLRMRPSGS